MKQLFKTITVFFFVSLILTGCKKDDEKSNFFRVDDTRCKIGSGCVLNYGTSGDYEGCLYQVYLASPEIVIDEYGAPASGAGQVIGFRFVSSSLVGVETGEYVFDKTSDPLPFLSFHYADYSLNWIYGGPYSWDYIVSGIIKVTNYGDDNYEISIDCEDEFGDQVTGYYKGPLIYADVTK